MKELLDTLATWQADGADVGRAVVVRTFGSAPRPEGAVLLYAADGRIAGSVSGGCVEGAAAEEIDRARADGHARVIRYGISDEQAWDVGLACGGTIDVLVEPAVPPPRSQAAIEAQGAGGHGAAVVTPLPEDAPPAEFGQHEPGDGAPPEPSSSSTTTAGWTARSATRPRRAARRRRPDALRDAAGRGRSSSAAGRCSSRRSRSGRGSSSSAPSRSPDRSSGWPRELGFETVVIDGRASFATPERFPDVDQLIVGWPDEVADEIGLGPERRGRGPDPRREVRRAGDHRGAPPRLSIRRRRRLAQDPGGPAPAAARAGRHARRRWRGCAARSDSISAGATRPRPRWRSSPRSSPSAMAAPADPMKERAVA